MGRNREGREAPAGGSFDPELGKSHTGSLAGIWQRRNECAPGIGKSRSSSLVPQKAKKTVEKIVRTPKPDN